jgi:hypothetical protein
MSSLAFFEPSRTFRWQIRLSWRREEVAKNVVVQGAFALGEGPPPLDAGKADGDRSLPRVLYVHLYEVRPFAEYISEHGYLAPHSKGDFLRVIITCDQSQAPLSLLQSHFHPFAWECYNGTPLPTFDVHRKIEQIHFSLNLDKPRAFQWNISLSLDFAPAFDSLEMKLKNSRLPVRWVDLPEKGWKAAIGLAYGEASCQDLLSCRDYCLMASHGDVVKFKKMKGGQEYAVKQVVKSEYKDAPFPAIAPDNLRIATASHYE